MNLTDLTVLTCPFNFALADNVNQHLDNLVTDAIRATGALLIFLPTSPEWNPVFFFFSLIIFGTFCLSTSLLLVVM